MTSFDRATAVTLHARILFLLTLIALSVGVILITFRDTTPVRAAVTPAPAASRPTSTRPGYLGDAACVNCHKEQALPYRSTAHHLTSQLPDSRTILGSFEDGANVLTISDPSTSNDDARLSFRMDAKDGRFFETAVAERGAQRLTHTEPIDIVVGSGVRGQTYLYWSKDQLYELPVSYWTDGHRWINSPGYHDGTANFSRHVDPRCLECHATYIKALSSDPQTNQYQRESFTPGIACETCHGPGATHVALEQETRKKSPAGSGILNPAKFERDRKVDQCALCHNGTQGVELMPAFSYVPGDALAKYITPSVTNVSPEVHGNQVGLLQRSRCYINSPTMSCATCHNVHAPERSAATYSDRCLTCHQWQSCGVARALGPKIKQNCIDCHMPVQATNAIVSITAGKEARATIRTHWIKVYSSLPQ